MVLPTIEIALVFMSMIRSYRKSVALEAPVSTIERLSSVYRFAGKRFAYISSYSL